MSIRGVKHELEARLAGRAGSAFAKASGKIERKTYTDLCERLKISLRGLEVRDDSIAVVSVGEVEVARVPIRDGRGRIDEESMVPGNLPALVEGQLIEVRINDGVVLSGTLSED